MTKYCWQQHRAEGSLRSVGPEIPAEAVRIAAPRVPIRERLQATRQKKLLRVWICLYLHDVESASARCLDGRVDQAAGDTGVMQRGDDIRGLSDRCGKDRNQNELKT